MRALLLLMIVAATLPMAFVRPIVGLILWVGFSYMNPHRIAFGFATGFPWVMLVALVTMFSLTLHARQRQAMPFYPITVLLVLYVVWTGITTLTAVESELAQASWIQFFKIQLMAFVTLILVTDRQRLHWIMWAIVLSFGFWGFKGGVFTIASGGGYHVLGPYSSFFRDNNDFALVMCMTLPLIRYLQLVETRRWFRYGLWALMGFTVVSILGTQSRGGFIALAAVALLLMMKSRRRAGLAIVGLGMVVMLVTFMPSQYFGRMSTIQNYEEVNSMQTRFESWAFATNVAIGRPLTGGGFDVYASRSMWMQYAPPGAKQRAVHSIYFKTLGEQGFIGLGLYLSMFIVAWVTLGRIRKAARAGPELYWMGDLASMIQVSIVGFAVAGAALPRPYFDLFYQLLALTVLLQLFMKKARVESPGESRYRLPTQAPVATDRSGGRRRPVSARQPRTAGTRSVPRW